LVEDLEWALKAYQSERRRRYELFTEYYDGEQRLAFATEKFRNTFGNLFKEFAENVCSPVVDSLADRLVVTGFKTSEAQTKTEDVSAAPVLPGQTAPMFQKVTTEDTLGQEALDLWKENRMDLHSADVHVESLKAGDGFVIVWPGDDGRAEIFPQEACMCGVEYDPDNKGLIRRGYKLWFDWVEARWRVNIYLPDMIEKYQSRKKAKDMPRTYAAYELFEVVSNEYGRVPMFHFPNAKIAKYGESELKKIIPLQDGLNKAVMDMMIAMEFASFKQRYIIGLDVEIDEATGEPVDPTYRNYGVDRILAIPDLDAKIGQFDATDLSQFLRVQEKFWASTARVSGTPLHYFFITQGDFPSGEAMKSAEARFVKRIKDRQVAFGNVWEDVLKFALRINGQTLPDDLVVETLWMDAAPKSESELADTAVKKKAVGVSRSQLLKEMGYDDETILRMLQEADAYASAQQAAQAPPQEQGTNPNGQPKPRGGGTQGVQK
jgi:hypothetical protein